MVCEMTLKPTDMLEIQSAIDAYERKFPRRPEPSAAVALAWRLGKKEWAKRLARNPDLALGEKQKPDPAIAEQECNRLVWVSEQLRAKWQTCRDSEEGLVPWVRKALVVGWWGVIAVVVASVFFFGALVGGFK
jgi:predicted amidohydrolase YtcJ